MNYLVTRHKALIELVSLLNINIDHQLPHLVNVDMITKNDCVYGNLPIELIAKICEKEAKYFNFNLTIPYNLRGKELTLDELKNYSCGFEQYVVKKV